MSDFPPPPVLALPQPLAARVVMGEMDVVPLLEPCTDDQTGRVLVYALDNDTAPATLRSRDVEMHDPSRLYYEHVTPLSHWRGRVIGAVTITGPIDRETYEDPGTGTRLGWALPFRDELHWATCTKPSVWLLDCPLAWFHQLGAWGFHAELVVEKSPHASAMWRVAQATWPPSELRNVLGRIRYDPRPKPGGFGTALD